MERSLTQNSSFFYKELEIILASHHAGEINIDQTMRLIRMTYSDLRELNTQMLVDNTKVDTNEYVSS